MEEIQKNVKKKKGGNRGEKYNRRSKAGDGENKRQGKWKRVVRKECENDGVNGMKVTPEKQARK